MARRLRRSRAGAKSALNIAAARAAIPALVIYCKANKARTVMQAVDAVLKQQPQC